MKTPVIHCVCQEKSIRFDVFKFMNLLPRKTLSAKEMETQDRANGESTAELRGLDVKLIHEERMTSSIKNRCFLAQGFSELPGYFEYDMT